MTFKQELAERREIIRKQRKEDFKVVQILSFVGFCFIGTAYFLAHIIAASWR